MARFRRDGGHDVKLSVRKVMPFAPVEHQT